MSGLDREPPEIDTTTAHAARIYAYYLGEGSAFFVADKVAADRAAVVHPGGIETVRASVRSNRAFLVRAVRWLAGEAAMDQFLDIGSGIPTSTSVHAVARQATSAARVTYVDNDPIVLAHSHELLGDSEAGTVAFIRDDLRDPASILEEASTTLDPDKPVAVLLVGVLHFLPDRADATDPYRIVSHLMEAVAPGSHLVVCHLARDIHPVEMVEVEKRFNDTTAETWQLRDQDEVRGFFDGLELIGPGVVQVDEWHPDEEPGPVWPPEGRTNPLWVGVGRWFVTWHARVLDESTGNVHARLNAVAKAMWQTPQVGGVPGIHVLPPAGVKFEFWYEAVNPSEAAGGARAALRQACRAEGVGDPTSASDWGVYVLLMFEELPGCEGSPRERLDPGRT